MLTRLRKGLPAGIPDGMFIMGGGTLLAVCDGVGIEFAYMTPSELRDFAALICSVADETESSVQATAEAVLATTAPLGSA